MSSAFKDKLRKIRDASEKRSGESLRQRSDEDLARSQRTVHAFEFREGVEAVIEDLTKNFQSEAPGFVLTRGFFEGKYMLALRCDEELLDADGKPARYFSRLMFLLDPHGENDTFALTAKKTIRNRDMESGGSSGPMNDAGKAELGKFIETQFLDFAERYFGEHTLSRPPVPT